MCFLMAEPLPVLFNNKSPLLNTVLGHPVNIFWLNLRGWTVMSLEGLWLSWDQELRTPLTYRICDQLRIDRGYLIHSSPPNSAKLELVEFISSNVSAASEGSRGQSRACKVQKESFLWFVASVNQWSVAPIQHQQDSPVWGVVKKEALFSAHSSMVKTTLLWGNFGAR